MIFRRVFEKITVNKILQDFLEILERSLGMGLSNSFHGIEVAAGILAGIFSIQNGIDIFNRVQHDFGKNHIFQRVNGLGVLESVESLKTFIEV